MNLNCHKSEKSAVLIQSVFNTLFVLSTAKQAGSRSLYVCLAEFAPLNIYSYIA